MCLFCLMVGYSSLGDHVGRVLFRSPIENMSRSNASGIVAAMASKILRGSSEKKKEGISRAALSPMPSEYGVSVLIFRAEPFPTMGRYFYLLKKPFFCDRMGSEEEMTQALPKPVGARPAGQHQLAGDARGGAAERSYAEL